MLELGRVILIALTQPHQLITVLILLFLKVANLLDSVVNLLSSEDPPQPPPNHQREKHAAEPSNFSLQRYHFHPRQIPPKECLNKRGGPVNVGLLKQLPRQLPVYVAVPESLDNLFPESAVADAPGHGKEAELALSEPQTSYSASEVLLHRACGMVK